MKPQSSCNCLTSASSSTRLFDLASCFSDKPTNSHGSTVPVLIVTAHESFSTVTRTSPVSFSICRQTHPPLACSAARTAAAKVNQKAWLHKNEILRAQKACVALTGTPSCGGDRPTAAWSAAPPGSMAPCSSRCAKGTSQSAWSTGPERTTSQRKAAELDALRPQRVAVRGDDLWVFVPQVVEPQVIDHNVHEVGPAGCQRLRHEQQGCEQHPRDQRGSDPRPSYAPCTRNRTIL